MDDSPTGTAGAAPAPTDSDWARGVVFVVVVAVGLVVAWVVVLQLLMCGCTTRPA
jgi:hypothetical protein